MPALEEELSRQFPVAPPEIEVKRTAVNRHCRSEIEQVLDIGRGHVVVQFSVTVVELRGSLFAQTCPLVAVDGVVGISDAGIGRRIINQDVGYRGLHIDVGHLIPVVAEDSAYVKSPVTGADRRTVQGDLKAFVDHLSVVDGVGAVAPALGRHAVGIGQKVCTVFIIVLHSTAQPVAQQGKVHSDVGGGCLLPSQVGIRAALNGSGNTAYMLVAAEIGRHIRGGVLRDVTADTIAETQLEHIDPVRTLHEFLAVDVPTGSHGPDGTFLVFRAGGEEVGLVPADTSAHGVPAVVGVGRIAVERYVAVDQFQEIGRILISKAAPAPDAAHGAQADLVDQGIGHQIRVVVVESAVLVIVLVLPGFGSHQRGNLVLAGEGLVEIQLLTEVVRSGNIV